jgi:hypothetical protein
MAARSGFRKPSSIGTNASNSFRFAWFAASFSAFRRRAAPLPTLTGDPLEPLNALVGSWTTEATHPAFPSTLVSGRADFEWLEGERFLVQRSRTDHPEFPDSLIVFGADGDELSMHYFDSRGVHRVYGVSFDDGVWRMWRHAPGFSQRFTGTVEDDGDTIAGLWKLSRDNTTWDDDLRITFWRKT